MGPARSPFEDQRNRKPSRTRSALVLLSTTLSTLLLASSCWLMRDAKDGDSGQAAQVAAADLPAAKAPRFCAALRGNGNLVLTHFTALARLIEHFGPVDGLAGGSSASITVFLYESMAMNPLLARGEDGSARTPDEQAQRLALLLKSVKQYITAIVTDTDEALAVRGLAPIAQRVEKEGVKSLLETNPLLAGQKLYTILASDDLKDLINPEILAMLTDLPNLKANAPKVYAAIVNFGKFEAKDASIFFRPGILNFDGLAAKLGRMGNFYAGMGPVDAKGVDRFLSHCAPLSPGKTWEEFAEKPDGAGHSCAAEFDSLVLAYRQKFIADEKTAPSRLDDPAGKGVHALAITSVLSGAPATKSWTENFEKFRADQPLAFAPAFEDVRYGYFGSAADLEKLTQNPRGYDDLKTKKRLALGSAPWRIILGLSPAEPGLSRVREVGPTGLSAGGWSDLHPVLALKNLGCEHVVYITRRGEDSNFSRGVAQLLGASPADLGALYDLDSETSSFSKSLAEADGVWCTNWDSFKDQEIVEMTRDAYEAPFETRDAFFTASLHPYPNLVERTNLRGCSPGAPPLPPKT